MVAEGAMGARVVTAMEILDEHAALDIECLQFLPAQAKSIARGRSTIASAFSDATGSAAFSTVFAGRAM
jgi:hypothetical protein